ncbi:hypothetical protein CHS0354_025739 [Potamilus streckersoni]|uniref:Uncharacterized protein n=1 Tax=Potamilus streckersoni TaxID=2493646 RepID=A0AAE0SE22_9BIVA|nr:hypothetical protein CHS0354_025739 [Potamilus streckersoni]
MEFISGTPCRVGTGNLFQERRAELEPVPVTRTPFDYGSFDSTQTTIDNPSMLLKQTITKYKEQASSYSFLSDLRQCKEKDSYVLLHGKVITVGA